MLSSAVIPALPAIQHACTPPRTGVTWLLTGYLLSASVATSILGRLGDMYGKEKLLLRDVGHPRRRDRRLGAVDVADRR